MAADETQLLRTIEAEAHPIRAVPGGARGGGGGADEASFDPVLDAVQDQRLVLLGEASHGTHEFYASRAAITRRLIEEKGFTAVAVEADWPDAYRLNRYVRGESDDASAAEALGDFERFPTWMWRNTEVVGFAEWLRDHNEGLAPEEQVGFYGIDLYSLHRSMAAVVDFLEEVEPEAAERARARYSCFDHYGQSEQAYGQAVHFGVGESCARDVVDQLVDLRETLVEAASHGGLSARDEAFFAEQNARVAINAEAYYRTMFDWGSNSWNLRDSHMFETLERLIEHQTAQGQAGKIAVWEHNSHLGDGRFTEFAERGQHNVGQLVRQAYGSAALLVGFSTHTGTVSAASDWGRPVERKFVRPSLEGSFERLFHDVDIEDFVLDLRDAPLHEPLSTPRLERAIGVIYRPETERLSHYFHARMARQFDLMIHVERTRALEPLERTSGWERGADDVPETFPTGI